MATVRMAYNSKIQNKLYNGINNNNTSNNYQDHLSYAEFLNDEESKLAECDFKHKDIRKCLDDILCYQSLMCKCEAEIFCKTTSRLSYELYKANNLCEVKEIVDIICCLFTSSATKETSLAQVIRAFYEKRPDKKGCDF